MHHLAGRARRSSTQLVAAAAGALLLGLAAWSQGALARTLERDVFALLALHQEVKNRDPQWSGVMGRWPVHTCSANGTCGVDPCGFEWQGDGWEGVSCRYQWDWDPSIPRLVTNFHLPKYQLTGPLPKALSLLANLTEVDLDSNLMTGSLPADWGCLQQLIEIDLSKNQLQGTIPQSWGVLTGLIELELDGNAGLSGCVPEGAPQFDRLCGTRLGPPCPGFTTDPVIGTDVTGTRIRRGSRCGPYPGGKQALAATLRCARPEDFAPAVEQFFAERRAKPQGQGQGRGQQPMLQAAVQGAGQAAPGQAVKQGAAVQQKGVAVQQQGSQQQQQQQQERAAAAAPFHASAAEKSK